jgi:Reverse transcriptase (RNA-dependent DNA polymerase)
LKKACNILDRGRIIAILKGYGVGKKILNFLQKIMDMDMMIPKQVGFLGQPFNASWGARQGDIISPIIFNIVADAVIRECMNQFTQNNPERLTLIDILFYADVGAIMGEEAYEVQLLLDLFTSTFARIGLKMNADKTQYMIMNGGKVTQPMSSRANE